MDGWISSSTIHYRPYRHFRNTAVREGRIKTLQRCQGSLRHVVETGGPPTETDLANLAGVACVDRGFEISVCHRGCSVGARAPQNIWEMEVC